MSFVNQIIEYTQDYESSTTFWKWSAYAAISGALRNNIYFPHKTKREYPNIYVILLADSAQNRKGQPLGLLSGLLKAAEITKVITGRNSIQYIMNKLNETIPNNKSGVSLKGGPAMIFSEELAASFVEDPAVDKIMTDLYDYKDYYPVGLKGSGEIILKDVCLAMLAASNETYLRTIYNDFAVFGGLLGRTCLVKPNEIRPSKSLLELGELPEGNSKPLIERLRAIGQLQGPVTVTDDAKKYYNTWYHALYKTYSKKPDRTGFTQRVHTTALKLAMIIAASELRQLIELSDIVESIDELSQLKRNYEEYSMSAGKSSLSVIGATFLKDLYDAKDNKLERSTFLLQHWNDVSATEFDELITTLEQGKMIKTIISSAGGMVYVMLPICKEKYEDGLKRMGGK